MSRALGSAEREIDHGQRCIHTIWSGIASPPIVLVAGRRQCSLEKLSEFFCQFNPNRSEIAGIRQFLVRRCLCTIGLTIVLAFVALDRAVAGAGDRSLLLATTSGIVRSGLLDELLIPFEAIGDYLVKVVNVGSGEAFLMGRNGDVDVLLVPYSSASEKFLRDGYGVNGRSVMITDYVVVGPAPDPARIRNASDVRIAFAKLALGRADFVSRGDGSATHLKERQIWRAAGVDPLGDWYREAGPGMAQVLRIADELNAYTLTDRITWLSVSGRSRLEILVEGDQLLRIPYAMIAVNPARFRDSNYLGAMHLIAWMTSWQGQAIIREHRMRDQRPFSPLAIPQGKP